MGITLDQLLDETGVNDLTGRRTVKTAAQKQDFAKLAERCRRAADASPEERQDSTHHELAEKTAAIAVINRTLNEIRAISGEEGLQKTAAAPTAEIDLATFIKTALENGHSPERIAEFLEKQGAKPGGLLSRMGNRISEMRAGRALEGSDSTLAKARGLASSSRNRFDDVIRKAEALDDAKRDALVSRVRVNHGDSVAGKLFANHKSFKDLPSARGLRAEAAEGAGGGGAGGGPKKALGVNVGGAQIGVTSDQLKKMKTPALAVGAGFLGHKALTRNDDAGEKKNKGVVVVNS